MITKTKTIETTTNAIALYVKKILYIKEIEYNLIKNKPVFDDEEESITPGDQIYYADGRIDNLNWNTDIITIDAVLIPEKHCLNYNTKLKYLNNLMNKYENIINESIKLIRK